MSDGGDLLAMESRLNSGDLLAGQSEAVPNYNMQVYKNMMQQGKSSLGQSRARLLNQYSNAVNSGLNNYAQLQGQNSLAQATTGQNSFAQRGGGVAGGGPGLTSASTQQFPAYDYSDYPSAVGASGGYNRRQGGLSGYGNIGMTGGYGGYGAGNRNFGLSGGGQRHGGSGYGGGGYAPTGYSPVNVVSGYGPGVCEDKGLNPALVLATVAGAALAFFVIYRQVTSGGKRNLNPSVNDFVEHISNLAWSGLEEFEEKIDKIAEGQDGGEDNWISKIYNQFSFFNEVDDTLTDADMDGLEPPLLDETWGLGVRNASVKNITANTTIEEPVKLNTEESSRKKRSIDDDEDVSENDDEEEELVDTEEKCRVDMWRCLSKVIEGGLHYIDDPDGLMGLAKKTMFKIAFHGGFSNVWSGVMTIPEARHIKQCMNDHSECVSYEILRREAEETLDPSDPAYEMYRKKPTKVAKEKKDDKEEKKPKRERLIINPEFVESLDQGDGSVQYDEDYTIDNNEV